jgi:hypothetical protein
LFALVILSTALLGRDQVAAQRRRSSPSASPCGTLQSGLEVTDFDGTRAARNASVALFADGLERTERLESRASGPRTELVTRCSVVEANARRAAFTFRMRARTEHGTRPPGTGSAIASATAQPIWRREARVGDGRMRLIVRYRVRRSAPSAVMLCALRLGSDMTPLLGIDASPTVFEGELTQVLDAGAITRLELSCNEGRGSYFSRNSGVGTHSSEPSAETEISIDVIADVLD